MATPDIKLNRITTPQGWTPQELELLNNNTNAIEQALKLATIGPTGPQGPAGPPGAKIRGAQVCQHLTGPGSRQNACQFDYPQAIQGTFHS